MPVMHPAEPWRRTGRYDIDELFKLQDRRGADMVLALTHEEIVTGHVAQVVRSYRDLPLILYHFQTKERDEARPRAGVLRTREFIMKDSYTFDRDAAGLDESYAKHVVAYDRIFDRTGLEWYRVEADVGMMGGSGAHEYMAPCAAGENDVALAPGYAANIEVASADAQPVELPAPLPAPEEVSTPGLTTDRGGHRARSASRPARCSRPSRSSPRTAGCCSCSCAATTASTRSSSRTTSARAAGRPARTSSRSGSAPPASSAPSAPTCRCCSTTRSRTAATSSAATAATSTCAASSPAATSPSSAATSARSRRGTRSAGQADPDRAGDRGREHLQARHALLRAARRHLPRRGGQEPPHLDGLLRDRPGADRRRRGRAVRRRGGHLLAARDRAVGRRARRPGQAGHARSTRWPSGSTTSWPRAGLERPLRRPRRGAGGEVRRRRAARVPAAGRRSGGGRCPAASSRCSAGAAARPSRWRSATTRRSASQSCGEALPDQAAAVRPRSLGAAAGSDAAAASR